MKQILISLLIALQVPVIFHIGGGDILERSPLTALCYLYSLLLFGGTYTITGIGHEH